MFSMEVLEKKSERKPGDFTASSPRSKPRSLVAVCVRTFRTLYLLAALLYTFWYVAMYQTPWIFGSLGGKLGSKSSPQADISVNTGNASPRAVISPALPWAEWGRLHGLEPNRDVISWKKPVEASAEEDNDASTTTIDLFLSKGFGESLQPSKVIPYYYRATNDIRKDDITITTLVTSDRFEVLAALVRKYRGPLSVTIHVSDNAATRSELLESLHELYSASPYMSAYVDVHLVIDSFDRQFNMWRNVARYFARTDYIMMLDVDFALCTDFRKRILQSPQVMSKLAEGHSAFVVPAFEYTKQSHGRNSSMFPTTKSELLDLVQQDKIGMFHKSWAPGHGSTNYTRYYEAQPGEVYKVNSYMYAYEPYVIYKKEGTPYCDERFIGYGANKAACLFELYLAGVSFYVLPDDFLIHQSHEYAEVARKNERKYNRRLYMDFREEVCFRYLSHFMTNGKLNTMASQNLLTECKKIKGFSSAAGKLITATLGSSEGALAIRSLKHT